MRKQQKQRKKPTRKWNTLPGVPEDYRTLILDPNVCAKTFKGTVVTQRDYFKVDTVSYVITGRYFRSDPLFWRCEEDALENTYIQYKKVGTNNIYTSRAKTEFMINVTVNVYWPIPAQCPYEHLEFLLKNIWKIVYEYVPEVIYKRKYPLLTWQQRMETTRHFLEKNTSG